MGVVLSVSSSAMLTAIAAVVLAFADVLPNGEQPLQPECRIHTDSTDCEYYPWRKAYSPGGGGIVTHDYAY